MDAHKVGSDIKEKSSYSVLYVFIELLSNEVEASKAMERWPRWSMERWPSG